MPSWKIHLKIANNIKEKLNIYEDKDKFMIGNILPDMYSGHIIKNMSKVIDYNTNHYGTNTIINGAQFCLPNYEMFKNIHINKLDDIIILGYLSHLMADYFFNKYTYTNCTIINEKGEVCGIKTKKDEILNCNKNTMTRIKQEDFNSYGDTINLEKCNYSYTSDIFNSLEKLETFKVEKDDIVKLINYLNSLTMPTKTGKSNALILFKKEKLDNLVDECSEFILNYINKVRA